VRSSLPASPPVSSGSATIPTLVDASLYLPPAARSVFFEVTTTVAADAFAITGGPEGYQVAGSGTLSLTFQTAVGAFVTGPYMLEYQGFYFYRSSGTGAVTIYPTQYAW
jgi:hypothetical protein